MSLLREVGGLARENPKGCLVTLGLGTAAAFLGARACANTTPDATDLRIETRPTQPFVDHTQATRVPHSLQPAVDDKHCVIINNPLSGYMYDNALPTVPNAGRAAEALGNEYPLIYRDNWGLMMRLQVDSRGNHSADAHTIRNQDELPPDVHNGDLICRQRGGVNIKDTNGVVFNGYKKKSADIVSRTQSSNRHRS
jgi:hypothetical protein